MAWLERRRKIFYIYYYKGKSRKVLKTNTSSRHEALRQLTALIEKLGTAVDTSHQSYLQSSVNPQPITCSKFAEKYLDYCETEKAKSTAKSDRLRLHEFFRFIAKSRGISRVNRDFTGLSFPLESITVDEIAQFKQYLIKTKKKASTAERSLKAVKAAFNYAKRLRLIQDDPTE